jgi:hypothetical protein
MKCCSLGPSVTQSLWSVDRSISSALQKDASACLYIFHTLCCCTGNRQNRSGLSCNMGSYTQGRAAHLPGNNRASVLEVFICLRSV